MLQVLVNVWWLFAAGFVLGAVFVLPPLIGGSNSNINTNNHWTKNASNAFGDFLGYVIGAVIMVISGILLIVCGIGALLL